MQKKFLLIGIFALFFPTIAFIAMGPMPRKRKAKLRLDVERRSLGQPRWLCRGKAPGKSGRKASYSLRISSNDPEERMPPHDSNRHLSNKEIDLLKEWIAGGAKWKGSLDF